MRNRRPSINTPPRPPCPDDQQYRSPTSASLNGAAEHNIVKTARIGYTYVCQAFASLPCATAHYTPPLAWPRICNLQRALYGLQRGRARAWPPLSMFAM